MRKLSVEIKWAIIFVVVSLAWMLGEKLAGFHDVRIALHPTATMFFAIPAIAVYVLALLEKRRSFYGGAMTYQQGFVSGLLVTLFVTILSPLTQIITLQVISPDYLTNAATYATDKGILTATEAAAEFSQANYLKQALIGAPIMGIVTSAIVAIFTRKEKKDVREGRVDVVYVDGPKTPKP
jgi:hypothetical protein